MFATGLNALPPSGIEPRPKLLFHPTSRFPVSSTCAKHNRNTNVQDIRPVRIWLGFWHSKLSWFWTSLRTSLIYVSCSVKVGLDFIIYQPCSSVWYSFPHRTPKSKAASDHSVSVDPQSVPEVECLHIDCRSTEPQTGPIPPVWLGTHSQFHQTWK